MRLAKAARRSFSEGGGCYRTAWPRLADHSGLWCNSSISPCEGDGPGANPGFLTNFDEPLVVDYRSKNETERGCKSPATERPGANQADAGSRPAVRFLGLA